MHVLVRCLAALVVASSFVITAAPAAAGPPPPVTYRPPVDAPISDPFRPPSNPYGAGNRGLEYATERGMPVAVAADGTVTFAGVVAGKRWVTIRHADGVRTTYGPLQDMTVAAGDSVTRGQNIGTAAGHLTFTARLGEAYVDPSSLFDGGPPRVRLIPEPLDRPGLEKPGGGISLPGADALLSALSWEWRHEYAIPITAAVSTGRDLVVNNAEALQDWNESRDNCTSAVYTPPPPPERRFALLVGGLGSSDTSAAIADVDTAALGYEAGDVVRFSYTGGRVPTTTNASPELADIPEHSYTARDTVGDLDTAGHRLAELITEMAAAVPDGAPIDVLAHSQGGLVTRVALHELSVTNPDVLQHVRLVVTLATPHQGADVAALVQGADANPLDPGVFERVQDLIDLPIEPDDVAVGQLAPGSPFLDELSQEPVPDGVHMVSIAGRTDLTVPSTRAHFDGATNIVVGVDGPSAHDQLPGSGAARREIALALAGMGPTCSDVIDAVTDATSGTVVQHAEDFLGAELSW
jgi:hypothetical protein